LKGGLGGRGDDAASFDSLRKLSRKSRFVSSPGRSSVDWSMVVVQLLTLNA
jgi:hypothetical protein